MCEWPLSPPTCQRQNAELGEMMEEQPKATGELYRGVFQTPRGSEPTLASQGIDKNLAKRALPEAWSWRGDADD
jgi:hypothetical protein